MGRTRTTGYLPNINILSVFVILFIFLILTFTFSGVMVITVINLQTKNMFAK